LIDNDSPENQHKFSCRLVLKTIVNKGVSEMDKISGQSSNVASENDSQTDNIPDNRLADYISTKCEPIVKTDQDDNKMDNS
jgi:hypothetical protein